MVDEKHYILRDGLLFVLAVLVGIIGWIGNSMQTQIKEQAQAIRELERTTIHQTVIQVEQRERLNDIKILLQQAADRNRR